jgi:gas vesicle protein
MRTGDFLAGVLVGALIGAALGLAFAPEAGEETRNRVAEKARELSEVARKRLQRAEGEAEEESGKK